MNAQVGVILKNAKMGNALFWTIGAVTAIIIGLISWEPEVFSRAKDVPVWLFTAGAMGAMLVFGIAWAMPQIGAGSAFVLMIAGQVITGMVIAHFGAFGSPVEHISTMKIFGAFLLICGVGLVTLTK